MLNFNKNKLINETLDKYYETFSHTLDTADYVPDKFNAKVHKYIYKNMKKTFKKIDKEDRIYQKKLLNKEKQKKKQQKKNKQSWFSQLCCKLRYNRLKRKHRLLTYTPKTDVENKDLVLFEDNK